jgi:Rrf2 family protein
MLTKKAKYALKATAYLAGLSPDVLVSGKEIAEMQNIPKKFLDAILIELKNHGLIYSKKGLNGGYSLGRKANSIVVGDVIRVIDGPLAPIACASKTRYRPCDDCVDEASCRVKKVMQEAQQALSSVFDAITLEEMAVRAGQKSVHKYIKKESAKSNLKR